MLSDHCPMHPYFDAVTSFFFAEDEPEKADILFVPGSRDPEPAEHAATLFKQGFAPFVLPSGRFTKEIGHFAGVREDRATNYSGSYATEWELQRAILLTNGVPEESILHEDTATYTWDNAVQSRRVCDAIGLHPATALLACKPFHARRALLYYQAAFPQTRILCCPCPFPVNKENWRHTPEGRALVLGEVRRLGSQVNEVVEDACHA